MSHLSCGIRISSPKLSSNVEVEKKIIFVPSSNDLNPLKYPGGIHKTLGVCELKTNFFHYELIETK